MQPVSLSQHFYSDSPLHISQIAFCYVNEDVGQQIERERLVVLGSHAWGVCCLYKPVQSILVYIFSFLLALLKPLGYYNINNRRILQLTEFQFVCILRVSVLCSVYYYYEYFLFKY